MTAEMRILTVRQPWAWAITHDGKAVENRSRNIAGAYRGPIAIHAAKADDDEAWRALGRTDLAAYGRALDARESLVGGAIIGVVDLVDVHWSGMECMHTPGACHEYDRCSPWAEAYAHHLVLANSRSLAEPIPYRGALGLRTLDPEMTARILAQIGDPDGR